MAIEEHDREDLLRDGRMMPLRGECLINGATVVAGLRSQGQLSLYCGPDPVFQFNADRELRRVFFQGRRFAAKNGCLVELTRENRGGKVEFASARVDPKMQTIILSSMKDWLRLIRDQAQSNPTGWRVIDGDLDILLKCVRDQITQISTGTQIANAPNV